MTKVNGISVDNLVESVYDFNRVAAITPPGHFNANRVGFYTGMQLEEMAEKIVSIAAGYPDGKEQNELLMFAAVLDSNATAFKAGRHTDAVHDGNRHGMLDADIDVAVVTIGSMIYSTPRFREAITAVLLANASKCPGGVAKHDRNGKVQKPKDWLPPDLWLYVDQHRYDTSANDS